MDWLTGAKGLELLARVGGCAQDVAGVAKGQFVEGTG